MVPIDSTSSNFNWRGGIVYKVMLPLEQTEFTINGRGIEAFLASPAQSEFTTAEDVLIDLHATVTGGLRIADLYRSTGDDPKTGTRRGR